MSKYRIVKNGLGQFFVEKLQYKENGLAIPRMGVREMHWVRCDYVSSSGQIFKKICYKTYSSLYAAKEALVVIKRKEHEKLASDQIEVVYEEGV